MKKQNKWLDNYGKADNANESKVTLPEGFVGDGYSSYNWKSPAWGGQFQTGGSIPGTVGFTYARTAGSAPSEGKYAKKTMPSAQNGQEMKFYQEGLDWKPKSMQDGGQEPLRVSTTDPEYRKLYENRQVGSWSPQYEAYNLPDLPEVTVTGKDESLKEAMYQGSNRFLENALQISNAPQEKMMELITGIQQTPSQRWGFQNIPEINTSQAYIPYSSNPFTNIQGLTASVPASGEDWKNVGKNAFNMGMDTALDPLNIYGVGILDDLTKGAIRNTSQDLVSGTFKHGITPYAYSFENVLRIPENLVRTSLGKQKVLPTKVKRAYESKPILKRRMDDTYPNREDAWSVYLGRDPESGGLQLTGRDESTGLSKYKLTKPSLMNLEDLKEYKFAVDKGRIPNTESFQSLDLDKPGDRIVALDNLFGVMGGHSKSVSPDGKSIMYWDKWDLQPFQKYKFLPKFIRDFEVSSVVPGAKPFVSEGKLADIKTKYFPAKPYENIAKRYEEELEEASYQFPIEYHVSDWENPSPEEIFNYDQKLKELVKERLKKQIKNEKTFLNPSNSYSSSRKYADFAPYIKVDKSKKKEGGVIKDNRGQWNHPGEITEIDSPYITMEGVPYPVIGQSNTGDTKLMLPGENYKFKGKKVTEFPIAQWGKGVPFKDAATQPKNPANPVRADFAPPIRPRASFEEQKRIAKLELDKYGYTSDQRKGYVQGKSEKAFNNIVPAGYGDLEQTLDRVERYQKNLGRNPDETLWYSAEESSTGKPIYYDLPKRDDAFALYLGLPQKNKSFGISEYQPTNSKENKYYFKPNYLDENLKNALVSDYFNRKGSDEDSKVIMNERNSFRQKRDSLEKAGVPWENPINAEWYADNPLGDFKMSEGKDEKGNYLSIYDVWDLSPFKEGKGSSYNGAVPMVLKAFAKTKGYDVDDDLEMSKLFGAGKPFEIYDRIYYDPKTMKVIPQKRNGGKVNINDLDAQPKKKLNQLLNFTNNPDKNWLDNL